MSHKDYIPFSEKNIPKTFLECKATLLQSLSDIPNILLYGKEGCGKYTRLMIMLNNYLGNLCDPYKVVPRAINVETGSFVPIQTYKVDKVIFAMTSQVHCEIELSQANSNKAIVPFLEYYSKSKNINLNIKKYVILRNVECLKKKIQNSLRRIVETSNSIIFMMTTTYLSNIIKPLQSRFLCIRVSSPSIMESTQIINSICKKNNFKITSKKIESIIEKSYYGSSRTINLRELLLTLEGSMISKSFISERNEVSDLLIKQVLKGNREEIRNTIYKIYEMMKDDFVLIITCDFFRKMINNIDEKIIKDFVHLTSYWNSEINKNHISQSIFQAEAYLYSVCDLIS